MTKRKHEEREKYPITMNDSVWKIFEFSPRLSTVRRMNESNPAMIV